MTQPDETVGKRRTRMWVKAIKSAGFVDKGANEEANIVIAKRRPTMPKTVVAKEDMPAEVTAEAPPDEGLKCPKCGSAIQASDTTCPACGADLMGGSEGASSESSSSESENGKRHTCGECMALRAQVAKLQARAAVAEATETAAGEGEEQYTGPPKIEVEKALLLVAGNLLEVRLQMYGIGKFDPEPATTYAINEETGAKYFVTWLRRIGRMGTTKQRSYQYLLFRIPEVKLKVGDRITVVFQGAKQEHIPVEGRL